MINKLSTIALAAICGAGMISAEKTAVAPLPLSSDSFETKYVPTRADEELPNAPTLTEIITEVEGRSQSYLRYGDGYFPYMGLIYRYYLDEEPSPSTIVYGTNGNIYFKDIMDFGWDSYTQGTVSGSKITVQLPQTLCEETFVWAEEPYYHNLCVMTQMGEELSPDFVVDPTITEVTFTIQEDGNIVLDPLPEGKTLGLMTYFIGKAYDTDDDNVTEDTEYTLEWIDSWGGAADFKMVFDPIGVDLIEMPADVEPITYYVAIKGYNYPVDVAFKDNYMYIRGLGDSPYISNFVVRATIEGDKAYIPQNQYVGVYKAQNEMVVTKCGYREDFDVIYEPDDVSFEFTIDKDRRFLQTADNDMYLCFAYMLQFDDLGQEGLLDYYNNFYILYQESFPGVPSNPFDLYAHDMFYDDYGYHNIAFQLTAISTENHILLTGNLYYSIYIDGDLEVFEYDPYGEPYSHYYTLPEPTSEIPFMFTNDNDIDIWSETERQVGFYYEGVSTVGVQAVYYYDDKRTVSDIVTLDLETGEVTITAGVDSITTGNTVESVEYYDISGRKIANPSNGLFIEKKKMSDGTSKVTKRIIR